MLQGLGMGCATEMIWVFDRQRHAYHVIGGSNVRRRTVKEEEEDGVYESERWLQTLQRSLCLWYDWLYSIPH